MDVNSLTSNKKPKRHHEGEGTDGSSIKICDLPDPILQLIISFLSTKDAVRTSVLSKRWVYLWRDTSRIQLEEGAPEKRQQFIDFARRLLEVCDCSNLEKFFLTCKVGDDTSQINEWLHVFINPKIQELNIDLEAVAEPLVFPDHLFTCATLTKFQLSMNNIFKIPSSIHFESLRTLTLVHIIFPDSSSTQQLFSGCPSLEELALYYCSWVDATHVCISSPMLQKLVIKERGEDGDNKDDDSDGNYDINGIFVPKCYNIVIVGTNLKSFSYDGDVKNDCYFLYSSTLVIDACVDVHAPSGGGNKYWDRKAGYFVFRLLKELSTVKKLSISEIALQAIDDTASLLGHLPLFCNLVELHVVSLFPIELSCEPLLAILRNSHCLRVIEFEGGVSLPKNCANNNYILDPLPMCFRTHLKAIKIYGFPVYDGEEELHAIKILLRAASVLKTLHISCCPLAFRSPIGSKRLKKLCEQIIRFRRGSVDCEIDLEFI